VSTDDPTDLTDELAGALRRDAAVRLTQSAYHWLQQRLDDPTTDDGLRNLADNLAFLLAEHDMRLQFRGDEHEPWVVIHAAGDPDDVRAGFPTPFGTPERVGLALAAAYRRLGYEEP
jgi:hypothetical protein